MFLTLSYAELLEHYLLIKINVQMMFCCVGLFFKDPS